MSAATSPSPWIVQQDAWRAEMGLPERGTPIEQLTDEQLQLITDALRVDEFGERGSVHADGYDHWAHGIPGGCHTVTEYLDANHPGATRQWGYFIVDAAEGELPRAIDHFWMVLPGGDVLDPTGDQFEEERPMRMGADHPLHARYVDPCGHAADACPLHVYSDEGMSGLLSTWLGDGGRCDTCDRPACG